MTECEIHQQGDQRQGKSGRISEFKSPVFKSGEVRKNLPFWRKSGNFIINQGKIREFRYSVSLLFSYIYRKNSLAPSALAYCSNIFHILVRTFGARILTRYWYGVLLKVNLAMASINLGSGKKSGKKSGNSKLTGDWSPWLIKYKTWIYNHATICNTF